MTGGEPARALRLESAISSALVRVMREFYGKGAGRARTAFAREVETLTGRPVAASHAQIVFGPDIVLLVFVLEA